MSDERVSENHPPGFDPAKEAPDEVTDKDREPGNLYVRAGYLRALAEKHTGDDRLFLLRAVRSLRAFGSLATLDGNDHRDQHVKLHQELDELVACFLLANKGKRPSTTTVLELMEWSHRATLDAGVCGTVAAGRPLDAVRNQDELEGRCYFCGGPTLKEPT